MGLPTGVVLPTVVGRTSTAETADCAAVTPGLAEAVDDDDALEFAGVLDELLLQALRAAAAASPMIRRPDLAGRKPAERRAHCAMYMFTLPEEA
jgi:hypothetical protein